MIVTTALLWGTLSGLSQDISLQLSLQTEAVPETSLPDSINPEPPYKAKVNWLQALKSHRLDLDSPDVEWPGFLGFCVKAYNWFNDNFNTYDPEYVETSDKLWKVRLTSDNWVDLYYFHPTDAPYMRLSGNINPNLGAYVNFLALSVGYSIDLRTLTSGDKARHKKFDLQLACSRLVFEGHYWQNSESAYIRSVEGYKDGDWIRESFSGLTFRSVHASMMYVFNYRKFSYGAAYNLANYQIKSAGSFMAGVMGTFYDATFDMTKLPPDIAQAAPLGIANYRLHYNSVLAIGGYSYNWVCNKHFMFNVSFFPAVGVSWNYADSSDGNKVKLALSGRQMFSLTYTNRQFFATLNSNMTFNMYQSHRVGFLSAIENFQLSTGVRF